MKTTAHTPLAARNRSVSPAGTRSTASYLDDRRPQTALQAKLAAAISGGSRSVQLQRNLAQLFASPVQTKMPEEQPLQSKMWEDEVRQPAAAARRSGPLPGAGPALQDNRPESVAQREFAEAIESSSRMMQRKALCDSFRNSPYAVAQRRRMESLFGDIAQRWEREQLPGEPETAQGMDSTERSVQLMEQPAPKPNHTGLPDRLKSGIESLSGLSMDNVRVHYNSAQPAQLNALAYAQGINIHVAPGQEQHLPHEAWHLVQQAQGRVRPSMQMKRGVAVNDDSKLESEAAVMGRRAGEIRAIDLRRGLSRFPPQVDCPPPSREGLQLEAQQPQSMVSASQEDASNVGAQTRTAMQRALNHHGAAIRRNSSRGFPSRFMTALGLSKETTGPSVIQRMGPDEKFVHYVEADDAHLHKHLQRVGDTPGWEEYGVQSVGDVKKIAKELFHKTKKNDWIQAGHSYAVDHDWISPGGTQVKVRLVWGHGGIVSCFVLGDNAKPLKKPQGRVTGRQREKKPESLVTGRQREFKSTELKEDNSRKRRQRKRQQEQVDRKQRKQEAASRSVPVVPPRQEAPPTPLVPRYVQPPPYPAQISSAAQVSPPAGLANSQIVRRGYTWLLDHNGQPSVWYDKTGNPRARFEEGIDWWKA